jgi:antitoxin VapB
LIDTNEAAVETTSVAKAKLFAHGRSQAVRLPKEFRFEGTEVFVRRVGEDVVLSSKPKFSIQSLVESLDSFEPGFQIERAQPVQADQRAPMLTGVRSR